MTYFICNIIQETAHLKIGVYAFIGSGVIVALINLYQIYANPEILAFNYLKQGVRIIRSTGAENDPNVFASNLPNSYLRGLDRDYHKEMVSSGIVRIRRSNVGICIT